MLYQMMLLHLVMGDQMMLLQLVMGDAGLDDAIAAEKDAGLVDAAAATNDERDVSAMRLK